MSSCQASTGREYTHSVTGEPQKERVLKPGPVPECWLPYLHSEAEDLGSGAVPGHRLDDYKVCWCLVNVRKSPTGKLG